MEIAGAALLGLAFGSFLTVLIHRTPRHEPVGRGRSRCPSCGATLTWRDNVPVVSWLVLRGRCRHCGARISPVYPLVEVATAGLFVAAVLRVDDLPLAAVAAPFLGLMLAIAVVDARHRLVPNAIVYPSLIAFPIAFVALRAAGRGVDLTGAAIGFAAFGGGLFALALLRPGGMGMGDVKLAALIGLVCGAFGLRLVAVAAGVGILAGGVGGVVALLAGASRKTALPFGPFLALGAVTAVLFGDAIARAYLGLLG